MPDLATDVRAMLTHQASLPAYTAGPWEYYMIDENPPDPCIVVATADPDPARSRILLEMDLGDGSPAAIALAESNAKRIVACINACAGVPTRLLEAGAALDRAERNRRDRIGDLDLCG